MGPEKWKGERPSGEPADEASDAGAERKQIEQPGSKRSAADPTEDDPREEEGYFQPESSAQKGYESPQE